MRSSELRARTCILRNQVQHLRGAIERRPELLARPATAVARLMRDVARGAREVEAWGGELVDLCALAAAAEAHQVIALARQAAGGKAASTAAGAVAIVQLRHSTEVEAIRLTDVIRERALEAIVAGAPCRVEVSLGLLRFDDQAVLDWVGEPRPDAAEDLVTTVVPLLVVLRSGPAETPDRLLRCTHAALLGSRIARGVPWTAETAIATLPIPAGLIDCLVRRCVGGLLVARSGDRSRP